MRQDRKGRRGRGRPAQTRDRTQGRTRVHQDPLRVPPQDPRGTTSSSKAADRSKEEVGGASFRRRLLPPRRRRRRRRRCGGVVRVVLEAPAGSRLGGEADAWPGDRSPRPVRARAAVSGAASVSEARGHLPLREVSDAARARLPRHAPERRALSLSVVPPAQGLPPARPAVHARRVPRLRARSHAPRPAARRTATARRLPLRGPRRPHRARGRRSRSRVLSFSPERRRRWERRRNGAVGGAGRERRDGGAAAPG
mmetsp:Transcript_4697/g.14661  ORF Transcript_4697/g.14661 Transcript_4697/m.14661 type:complete len:254 (-) Transcript_4697:775-1536(-)